MSTCTYAAENDTLSNGQEFIKVTKDFEFVLLALAVHVQLLDAIDAKFFSLESDFISMRSESNRKVANHISECCRKEDDLT